jgi:hypothetical protein
MPSYGYFCANHLDCARVLYDAALKPLGMERCLTNDAECERASPDGGSRRMAAGGAFGLASLSTSGLRRSVMAAWSY